MSAQKCFWYPPKYLWSNVPSYYRRSKLSDSSLWVWVPVSNPVEVRLLTHSLPHFPALHSQSPNCSSWENTTDPGWLGRVSCQHQLEAAHLDCCWLMVQGIPGACLCKALWPPGSSPTSRMFPSSRILSRSFPGFSGLYARGRTYGQTLNGLSCVSLPVEGFSRYIFYRRLGVTNIYKCLLYQLQLANNRLLIGSAEIQLWKSHMHISTWLYSAWQHLQLRCFFHTWHKQDCFLWFRMIFVTHRPFWDVSVAPEIVSCDRKAKQAKWLVSFENLDSWLVVHAQQVLKCCIFCGFWIRCNREKNLSLQMVCFPLSSTQSAMEKNSTVTYVDCLWMLHFSGEEFNQLSCQSKRNGSLE